MKDHLIDHLETRIQETQEAIRKYCRRAKMDKSFIDEFAVSSPETAKIYTNWLVFGNEKVHYFQGIYGELQGRLLKRKGELRI